MPAPTFTISNINVPGGPAGTVDFKDIAFSPTLGVIVVVGSLGTATATCMRSADGGNTWSFPTMPVATTWLGVVWSPTLGKFFACNPSNVTCAIASSPDGTTWTNEASKAAVPCAAYCIEWSPSLGILVVGSAAAGVSTTRFARRRNVDRADSACGRRSHRGEPGAALATDVGGRRLPDIRLRPQQRLRHQVGRRD
jgi:hypothetical protein